MKSTSTLEEFLQICEQNHMDGSGHSIEVLSTSEMNGSSEVDTPSSVDVLQTEAVLCSGDSAHNGSIACGSGCLRKSSGDDDRSVSEDIVEETPPEECVAPAAHSTPNPCDDAIGFWINPDEMPDHLKAATIRVARKYLMK
ncbi:hypothetical protein Aduo_017054 [Ancylostoma duodenale]